MFSFLLLGWWNIAVPVADWYTERAPTRLEIFAAGANLAFLCVVAVVLWALWDWIALDNHRKYGTLTKSPQFSDFITDNDSTPYISTDTCIAEAWFEGIWLVDDFADQSPPDFNKIIFWRNRTYEKFDLRGSMVEEGWWRRRNNWQPDYIWLANQRNETNLVQIPCYARSGDSDSRIGAFAAYRLRAP